MGWRFLFCREFLMRRTEENHHKLGYKQILRQTRLERDKSSATTVGERSAETGQAKRGETISVAEAPEGEIRNQANAGVPSQAEAWGNSGAASGKDVGGVAGASSEGGTQREAPVSQKIGQPVSVQGFAYARAERFRDWRPRFISRVKLSHTSKVGPPPSRSACSEGGIGCSAGDVN
jgi:hypothetical protein